MVGFRFVPVGPVRAAHQLWRSHGKLFATVVVKATFGPDGRPLLDGDPICDRDVHADDSPTRSLVESTDLVPYLGTGEVLFRGAAYAPKGGQVQARLSVMRSDAVSIDKRLVVRGPPNAPDPVVRVPVTYENSLGGVGSTANPVGQPQPLLLHATRGSEPAALGPIAPIWRSRTALLGSSHKRPRGAIMELEAGFPWEYFHAAPPDQRSREFFRGDETIRLEHLHPARAVVELKLPGAQAEARVLRSAHASLSVGFNLDVLRVDGDRLRVSATWRGFFEVPSEQAKLILAVGLRLPGQPVSWPPAAKGATVELRPPRATATGEPASPELDTTAPPVSASGAPLPFSGASDDRRPRSERAAPLPGAPWGAPAAPVETPMGMRTVDRAPARSAAVPVAAIALPIVPVAPPAVIRPPPAASAAQPMAAAPPRAPGRVSDIVDMTDGLGSELLIAIASRRLGGGSS